VTRQLVLTGKQGPAFGDGRPSHTEVTISLPYGSVAGVTVDNWAWKDRGDAIRCATDSLINAADGIRPWEES